jgi:hypothetical protein
LGSSGLSPVGPAAAYGVAGSFEFEQPIVAPVIGIVSVAWRWSLGWEPLPVARAAFEPESAVMAEVVVMAAQPGKVPEGRLAVLDHGDDAMVDFEAVSDITAGDDTGLVPLDHCSP